MKNPIRENNINILNSFRMFMFFVLSLVMIGGSFNYVRDVRAESVQEEINRLAQENASNQSALEQLKTEATSYQDAISKMQTEISDLEAKLQINLTEQERINGEIKKNEVDLAKQKDLLGKNIRTMYVEGDMSTIEMLASSNDLSEFVDKEQYQNSIKDKITETLGKINELKHQLNAQKEQVDKLIAEQNLQREKLALSRSEQTQLLSMNQGQQTDFNNKIKSNASRLQQLIASQRDANFTDGGYYFIRFAGAIGGINPDNYEYRDWGHSQADAPCPGPPVSADSVDRWGYCTRQCVSYAAWAVAASGRTAPKYWGDAKKWVANAYAEGIPVYRTPQPGDVAISTNGHWGHAMYVESVSGNTFNTTEYNTGLDGKLYRRTRTF